MPASPSLRAAPSVAAQVLMFAVTSLAMSGNYYVYDSIAPVADLLSRQLGFSDTQIGALNAIYSLPNVFMVLIGGVLIDRYSARSVALVTATVCLAGAVLTALGTRFPVMAAGRLLFGLGAETWIVAITVALAQWFAGRWFALALALNISAGRMGSYLADRSPTFASGIYAQGWQPPLWLACGFGVAGLLGTLAYFWVDRREAARGSLQIPPPPERIEWRELLRFRTEYWLVVGLCVAFYSVIFPFRSTFAIKYFQDAHGMSLEDAGTVNSYVFLAAVFATPVFGLLVDRYGRHASLLTIGSQLLPLSFLLLWISPGDAWVSTVLLGISFSLVPAVVWPAVARYVAPEHLGTAYGLMTMMQNAGLTAANVLAGYINDVSGASAANPGGYAAMLLFFGVLSFAGFVFSAALRLRERGARIAASVTL